MKSKYQTLKDIVNYVNAESDDPISELLMMGFDPYQLVNVFGFDANDVKKSEAYRNGNWDLDQEEDPFRLDLYEPFDAALVNRFKLTNKQFAKFKDTTVYMMIYNAYMDDKVDCETELFNGIFDEHEDNILEELEFVRMDEDLDSIDDESKPVHNWIDIPLYLECANYAYEVGELDSYKSSHQANIACKEAIESEISIKYNDNRLATKEAVETVVSKFGWDRLKYVLAITVNGKVHDGRIASEVKAWAKTITVAPEVSAELIIDSVNPGLIDLFAKEIIRQEYFSQNEEQFHGFCIIGVTDYYVRKYYSEVCGWTPEAKYATVYTDQDQARKVWSGLVRTGFRRIFVPNFNPNWINDQTNKELSDAVDFLKIADPKYLKWRLSHAEFTSDAQLILYARSLQEKKQRHIRVLCKENIEEILKNPQEYLDIEDDEAKKPLLEITSEVNPKNPKTISLSTNGEEYCLLVTGDDFELPVFPEENQTLLEVEEDLLLGLR